jgi:hypothetical protein
MKERPPLLYPASRAGFAPLWIFLGLAGALIVLPWLMRWNIPIPQCQWKKLTGIPCPACGSTRCLAAIASLQLATALQFNPLAFLVFCAVPVWFFLWIIDRFWRKSLLFRLRQQAERWPFWIILAAAGCLNWIYLIFSLP